MVGVEGSPVPVNGVTVVEVKLGGHIVSIDFFVVDSLKVEFTICMAFLEKHGFVNNLKVRVLHFRGVNTGNHPPIR